MSHGVVTNMSSWPDFNRLMELARQNPEELEKLRHNHVEAIINAAPEEYRRRLRGLQFHIDCKRRTHKTPLSACIDISNMMHDSLARLNRALNGGYPEQAAPNSARVLRFPA